MTITYSDWPDRGTLESFGDYIMRSSWLSQVGRDYGIGLGSNTNIELPADAPATIDDSQIQPMIASWIQNGTVPAGTTSAEGLSNVIYMLYFPSSTTVSNYGSDLCTSLGGYHSVYGSFTYAVVEACNDDQLDETEAAASHEIIEAATDPSLLVPAYKVEDPWGLYGSLDLGNIEVADLCFSLGYVGEGDFTAVPVWSNSAAAAGDEPCIPSNDLFCGVSASPPCIQPVRAGGSYTFTLAGWSTAEPTAGWSVQTAPVSSTALLPFTPGINLSTEEMNNGSTSTLTFTIPAGTPAGSGYVLSLTPDTNYFNTLPVQVGVYVP